MSVKVMEMKHIVTSSMIGKHTHNMLIHYHTHIHVLYIMYMLILYI